MCTGKDISSGTKAGGGGLWAVVRLRNRKAGSASSDCINSN